MVFDTCYVLYKKKEHLITVGVEILMTKEEKTISDELEHENTYSVYCNTKKLFVLNKSKMLVFLVIHIEHLIVHNIDESV